MRNGLKWIHVKCYMYKCYATADVNGVWCRSWSLQLADKNHLRVCASARLCFQLIGPNWLTFPGYLPLIKC